MEVRWNLFPSGCPSVRVIESGRESGEGSLVELSARSSGRIMSTTARMPYAAKCHTTVNAAGTFLKANPQ